MPESVRALKLGPLVLKHRRAKDKEGLPFTQWRVELGLRSRTATVILADCKGQVPLHRHPEKELFWFPRPTHVAIDTGEHVVRWMVTMSNQKHAVLEPAKMVVLKFGRR